MLTKGTFFFAKDTNKEFERGICVVFQFVSKSTVVRCINLALKYIIAFLVVVYFISSAILCSKKLPVMIILILCSFPLCATKRDIFASCEVQCLGT